MEKGVSVASAEEWAWAAGFYEGEGNFFYREPGTSRNGIHYGGLFQLAVYQKDPEPLEKFQSIAGCGHIYKMITQDRPYRKGGIIYHYKLTGVQRIAHVISKMWDWLSPRRKDQYHSYLQSWQAQARHRKSFGLPFLVEEEVAA